MLKAALMYAAEVVGFLGFMAVVITACIMLA